MNINNLCLGCMAQKDNSGICKVCGYDNNTPSLPLYLKPTTILNGKYLIGKGLGHGGFGITYVGLDLNLDFKVAIKEYMPRSFATRTKNYLTVINNKDKVKFDEGLEKFLDEARTLAKFNNNGNIVGVRDFFKENGTAYIVMDFLEGCDLSEYIKKLNRPLSYKETVSLLSPVFDSLKQVHDEGLLHRDISPDNIFISKNNQPILIDFGAARQYMNKGKALSVILKPGYAPPEQYRSNAKQGAFTDVYALAATMYHMLTGKLPADSLERLEKDCLIAPSSLGVHLPIYSEKALLKALSVQPNKRFKDMLDFKNAFIRPNANIAVVPKSNLSNPVMPVVVKNSVNLAEKSKQIISNIGLAEKSKRIVSNINPKSIDVGKIYSGVADKVKVISEKIDSLAPDDSNESKLLVRILIMAGASIIFLLFIAILILIF